MQLDRNKRRYYLIGFFLLLLIEISIAKYVQDDFVRPYLGDFLVVILLYCFLMSVSKLRVRKGLIIVLFFSFAVEFFQLIDIEKILQFQPSEIFMIVLGSSFSVWDLLAYSLGIIFCYLLEYFQNTYTYSSTKSCK